MKGKKVPNTNTATTTELRDLDVKRKILLLRTVTDTVFCF